MATITCIKTIFRGNQDNSKINIDQKVSMQMQSIDIQNSPPLNTTKQHRLVV